MLIINLGRQNSNLIVRVILLKILLITLGCSFLEYKTSDPQQMEQAFQETLKIRIEPKINLLTDKNRYHQEDWIGIWVENRTNYSIVYPDQDLGLRAYQYNVQNGTWQQVDLGSELGNPRVTIVTPGPRSMLPSGDIPVDNIKASGLIRLVIIGKVEEGRLVAAYKDVEIID